MSLDLTKEKALKYSILAVEADNNHQIELSLKYYKKAIILYTTLLAGIDYLDDDSKKSFNLSNLRKYLIRAEKISSMLELSGQSFESDSEEVLRTPAFHSKQMKKPNQDPGNLIKTEKPLVNWDEIKGLENVKHILRETIHIRRKFQTINIDSSIPWQTILLFGPPCSGKRVLVEACCTELDSSLVSIEASKIPEGVKPEKTLKSLFEIAEKNRPAVVFIDEIHLLINKESESFKVLAEFFGQLAVTEKFQDLIIFFSTSKPWKLDCDVGRRVERKVYVPLPDWETRKEIIREGGWVEKDEDTQLECVAGMTDGFSAQDLRKLTKIVSESDYGHKEFDQNCKKNGIPPDVNSLQTPQEEIPSERPLQIYYKAIKLIKPSVNLNTFIKYQYFAEL